MRLLNFLKNEWLILTILLAPFIYLSFVWYQLPSALPIHWNLAGEVDNQGPRYLFPLLNIGIYLLLLLIPRIDPRKGNYQLFASTYYKLRLVLVLFFSALSTLIIAKAQGFAINLDKLVLVCAILLLTTIGNYMTTLRPNWFIGIRLPWTLESDTVWRKTHQLGGKLWFWLGLVLLIASFFLPTALMSSLLFGGVIIMVVIPVVYAYIVYHKEKQNVS